MSVFRKLLFQIVLWTAVPLLVIAAISGVSIYGHQQAMRQLVADRAARLARVTASDLSDRLADRVRLLQTLADAEAVHLNNRPMQQRALEEAGELRTVFDDGAALLDATGAAVADTNGASQWLAQPAVAALRAQIAATAKPAFAPAYSRVRPGDDITLAAVPMAGGGLVVGAFSPASLGVNAMLADLQIGQRGVSYIVDQQGQIIYQPDPARIGEAAGQLPGAEQVARGQAGALFYRAADGELWAVGYAPVSAAGWGVIVREPWGEVISPMLQFSVVSPLVVILAALVSLGAVYLTLRFVIRPLHVLDQVASRVAWGDFAAADTMVDGVQEVKALHSTFRQMASRIQRYQAGMQDYIAAVTQGQEAERKRLARELHDDTAQALVALIQRIKLAQRDLERDPGRAAARLQELESLATGTWQDVRRMSEDLRPPYLEQLGMVPALSMLAEQARARGGPEVSVSASGQPQRLPADLELVTYRIAQEALSNVCQHAQATHISLGVQFADNALTLTVQDNGIGFRPPELPGELPRQGHLGLEGMRERALLVGGRLTVESVPGNGTRVEFHVPYRPQDAPPETTSPT